ncbi:MAG: hypothetical protein JJU46_04910 [Balneolaceae bacterium]|nr:hypothetical protein [Balneolaceae bacterium]MCH8549941.1 hypothetical protein [Balneolaceae bacterium]
MKYLITTLFFSTVFLLTGCGLFSNPDKRVFSNPFAEKVNEHERLYHDLAGALASEKPCYLISPNSYTVSPGVAPINTSGRVVELRRSRCFSNVARRSMRPELCDRVKTASTILYSGTENSSDRCRSEVAAQQRISGFVMHPSEIVELAELSDSEFEEAMLALGIFPNSSTLVAYRSEREEQYQRCATRYVIYSEIFFDKIDELPGYGDDIDLEEMQRVEWYEHPYIQVPGFTHCFLADGANHWAARGVGVQTERSGGFIQTY